jgi:membrane protein YqaA with SNARE-associated domain
MDYAVLSGLFMSSFLAATVMPMSSEAVLLGVAVTTKQDHGVLWTVATTANTLGALLNWSFGLWGARFRDRPWFPISPETYDKASERFRRYGSWTLLFSWIPFVGDPVTLVAGAAGVHLVPFLLLVAIGKGARYAVILAFV